MKLPNKTLKQILVNSGYVSANDFDDAAKSAAELNKKIDDVLIFRGLINEESLGKLVAEHLKLPYVNVSRQIIPESVLGLIPEQLARSYRMIPFALEGQTLKLAMEDPTNFEALEFAKRQTNLQISPYYTTSAGLGKAIGQYKKNTKKLKNKKTTKEVITK